MLKFKKTALLTGCAILVAQAMPAYAAGVTSGVDITNQASVSFKVGNVDQTAKQSNVDSFRVDKKIIVTVAKTADASVSPNQQNAFTTFTVSNTSNSTVNYLLSAATVSGGVNLNGAPVVTDTNGNVITSLSLTADQTVTVRVRANINDVADGSQAVVSLTAQAANADGTVLQQDTGANRKTVEDVVFADAAGTDDALRDGKSSARATFTVAAANVSVVKTSTVLSDGLGNTDPTAKAIPGATVQYCIAVTNAANAAAATSLVVSDIVNAAKPGAGGEPATLGTIGNILVNATVDANGKCSGGVAGNGAYNAATYTVTGTLSDMPKSTTATTRALSFTAVIQ